MAQYQASGALAAASSTTVTPALPAHQADDILICVTSHQHLTRTCATPAGGWAVLAGPVRGNSLISTYWFWKRATSSAEANPSCVWSGSGSVFGSCHSVRYALDPASPFDVVSGVKDQTDPFVVAGVSTAQPGELILLVSSFRDQIASAVTVTATDPASFAQHFYAENSTGGNITQTVHSATREDAGATGDITYDFNAAMPDDGHVCVIAFKERAVWARPGAYAVSGAEAFLDDSGTKARATAVPVDVLLTPIPAGRLTALPVDVLVQPADPQGRLTALPVDVLIRRQFDRVQVIWHEEL